MAKVWFVYNCPGSIYDPTSYTIVAGQPNCPEPKISLCAIYADIQLINGVQRPIITADLQAEMARALTDLVETDNVKLRPPC